MCYLEAAGVLYGMTRNREGVNAGAAFTDTIMKRILSIDSWDSWLDFCAQSYAHTMTHTHL